MKYNIKQGKWLEQKTDCLIVGVHTNQMLTEAAQAVDHAMHNLLGQQLTTANFEGHIGDTLVLHQVSTLKAQRILLVGCGEKKKLNPEEAREILSHTAFALKQMKARSALSCLTDLTIDTQDVNWLILQSILIQADIFYVFDTYKTKKTVHLLKEFSFFLSDQAKVKNAQKTIEQAQAMCLGIQLTKDLAHTPSNVCTPSYLAKQAQELSKQYSALKTTVLSEAEMKKLGMNALLSVSKGSNESAKLILTEYKGNKKNQKPIVLVGKGVTFDTGGISLKPASGMLGMKFDMCGAATVLGTLKAIAEMQLPLNVVGIIPTTENMPSGGASKPEDIVTSMAGITIEILNTDAEGRLILCDALAYAKKYDPAVVIDIATLTGAIVIALGHHTSGLFSNDQALADDLLKSGNTIGDYAWQLPLRKVYQKQIETPYADIANTGGRGAGSITAACFLSRFTEKYRWAHLDVAGTAHTDENSRKATGRPVPLLLNYLLNYVE